MSPDVMIEGGGDQSIYPMLAILLDSYSEHSNNQSFCDFFH